MNLGNSGQRRCKAVLRTVEEEESGLDQPGARRHSARSVADRLRLQQILVNLIANACKFTQEGNIVVSAAWGKSCKEDLQEDLHSEIDTIVLVKVSDTGCGIDDNKLVAIFNSFEQAHGSASRQYGGVGLGLAIVKALVQLQGGRVWATSCLGQGSVFLFTLPRASAAATTLAADQDDAAILERVYSFSNQIVASRRSSAERDCDYHDPAPELAVRVSSSSPAAVENYNVVSSNAPRVLIVDDNDNNLRYADRDDLRSTQISDH